MTTPRTAGPFLPTVPAGLRTASPARLGAALLDTNPVVDGVYSMEALTAAFGELHEPENWKLPFRVAIPAAALDLVSHAAVWFTGGRVVVEAVTADRWAVVAGLGYYHHIGA